MWDSFKFFLIVVGILAILAYPIPVTIFIEIFEKCAFIRKHCDVILAIAWFSWLAILILVGIVIAFIGDSGGSEDDAYIGGSSCRRSSP